MKELRKNEFIEMLIKADLLYDDRLKFIHCDIPTLGKITYYPKANKIQISRTNTWEEGGFEFVKNILNTTTIVDEKLPLIYENTSLHKNEEDKFTKLSKEYDDLRDDFAKNALIGILSNNGYNELISGNNGLPVPSEVVRLSYEFADEFMIQKHFVK